MGVGLFFHRVGMIAIAPVIWALATLAHAVFAPLSAAENVLAAIKMHWNDQ